MSLDLIKTALAQGGEHLGDLIFWSLSEARVERLALESLWSSAGLSAELLPDAPTAEKALKLAVRESGVGQADRLLRLAKEDTSEIVFAVVREQRPGDGSLDYNTEARIQLDRQREVFTSDRPGHDLVSAVRTRFEMYRTHHAPPRRCAPGDLQGARLDGRGGRGFGAPRLLATVSRPRSVRLGDFNGDGLGPPRPWRWHL